MNRFFLFTVLALVVLVLPGCESLRDAMLSDGGRFLTDTLANSVGMMFDEKIVDAMDGMVTGDAVAESLRAALHAGLTESKSGGNWWEIAGAAAGAGGITGVGAWYRGRLLKTPAPAA